MNLYFITIEDELFGQMSGAFEGFNQDEAIEKAKNFYAEANDTYPDAVEIVSTRLIGEFKTYQETEGLYYFPKLKKAMFSDKNGTRIYDRHRLVHESRLSMDAYKYLADCTEQCEG